jgi:DNA-binding XRE family transcriptional regulator
MKEFELTIRLRNNRLKARRDVLGVTQDEMAQAIGVDRNIYQRLESLSPKLSSQDAEGNWTKAALKIAEYHDVDPSELFPPSVRSVTAPSTKRALDGEEIEAMVSAHQLRASADPERLLTSLESRVSTYAAVRDATAVLTPRQTFVLRRSFGFDTADGSGDRLAEIGAVLKVTRSRVGVIREEILHKLRKVVAKRMKKEGIER